MYSFSINFQGTNLDHGLTPEDYLIRVENVVCPVKQLTSNFLRCDLSEGIKRHNLLTSKAILTITVCINKNSFNLRVYSW